MSCFCVIKNPFVCIGPFLFILLDSQSWPQLKTDFPAGQVQSRSLKKLFLVDAAAYAQEIETFSVETLIEGVFSSISKPENAHSRIFKVAPIFKIRCNDNDGDDGGDGDDDNDSNDDNDGNDDDNSNKSNIYVNSNICSSNQ